MRLVVPIVVAFLVVACGPDPNARLPGSPSVEGAGGISSGSGGAGVGGATVSSGGSLGNGGAPGTGGAGTGGIGAGGKPSSGGASGSTSSGGATGGTTSGTGGTANGGASGQGGVASGGSTGVGTGGVGSGGTTSTTGRGGSGGTTTASTGELASYTFPDGTEPCTPTLKDASGGHSEQLGAGAACFRTADEISDWSCSGAEDRTVKVNATAVSKCGGAVKKAGSLFYFEFSAGTNAWATVSWWCSTCGGPGTHPVPSCGHYPPWQPGKTVGPCEDATTTDSSPDAAAPTSTIDSGS